MRTTKIFKSGNSQALRLPKDFQIHSTEVEIFKRDGDLIIREIPQNLAKAFTLLAQLPADIFSEGREDYPSQERDQF